MTTNSSAGHITRTDAAQGRGSRYLKIRRGGRLFAASAFLVVCWRAAEISPSALFDWRACVSMWAFIQSLFPPDLSPGFLTVVLAALGQTVAIAAASTLLSVTFGLLLGVLATGTLWRRGILLAGESASVSAFLLAGASRAARALLSFLRAVPDLIWAVMFVVAVGLGPLAGMLALSVSYTGVMGRVYADVFEDVDSRPLEALQSTGATRAQIFLRGIWPQAASLITAYTLYSFECCVRAATVLGFVGAGGIGYEINLSMRLFDYGQVLTLMLALVALLAAIDAFSRRVRLRIREGAFAGKLYKKPKFLRVPLRSRPLPTNRAEAYGITAVAVVVAAWSFYSIGITQGALFEAGLAGRVVRFIGGMFPPDLDPAFLKSLAVPLIQTIGISVMGTIIGIAIGAALALPATSTLVFVERDKAGKDSFIERALRRFIYYPARLALNVLRSIPELVWVLICILAVGLGAFAGTLAIGLHTGGVLGKLYAETLEEAPARPIEALRASGARPLQLLIWGIIPQVRPLLVSYTVLRWEANLRISTILGLVGGGGLGQALYNKVQLGFYPQVATIIAIIYMLVIATEWLGERWRERMAAI